VINSKVIFYTLQMLHRGADHH